jgi:hypothetical protein
MHAMQHTYDSCDEAALRRVLGDRWAVYQRVLKQANALTDNHFAIAIDCVRALHAAGKYDQYALSRMHLCLLAAQYMLLGLNRFVPFAHLRAEPPSATPTQRLRARREEYLGIPTRDVKLVVPVAVPDVHELTVVGEYLGSERKVLQHKCIQHARIVQVQTPMDILDLADSMLKE